MPRIDPLQLLKCLGVLLTPDGGIRSKDEVQRLASLMMKFSKKLVSKCVYILILKNTDAELLGMFMTAGGWTLVFTWLSDGICGKNWALVTELLELLLICPVDVERLKSNSIPRLVKGLSKDDTLGGVNALATQLVDQWLKIVKDEAVTDKAEIKLETKEEIESVEEPSTQKINEITVDTSQIKLENATENCEISPTTFYKLSIRDGKQVIKKIDTEKLENEVKVEKREKPNEVDSIKVEKSEVIKSEKREERLSRDHKKDDKSHDKSKHRSHRSSSHSSHKSSSSRDKVKDRHRDRDRDRDRHKDRDKKRDHKSDKDKDKEHRSNGSIKSSSKDKEKDKEKQAEKDKATLDKIKPPSIEKLGKIPKKSSSSSDKSKSSDKSEEKEKKKPSISIEVRKKGDGDRPKTVKVFHSKLRCTGLEESPKPPPSRTAVNKKSTAMLPSVIPLKRSSPSREAPPPPEKKLKLPQDHEEKQSKPGGIKLIPPKPKPTFLQESDMFMDALAASCTNKKEPKKRKRKTSTSKDDTPKTNSNNSPPNSPTPNNNTLSPLNSLTLLKSIAPKFYKETLEEDETKKEEEKENKTEDSNKEDTDKVAEMIVEDEKTIQNVVKEVNGLRGVLIHHKRRVLKKSVKWKSDEDLEEVQYFELDETERVNVTKTFIDMKHMEQISEREAFQQFRKLSSEDVMDERTSWKPLIPVDLPPPLAEHGCKSSEKAIQYAREKSVLASLYFNRNMLPDTAAEPDVENQPYSDPISIPLDDATDNPNSLNDFTQTPWPEPKGSPPHIPNMPPTLFPPNLPNQFMPTNPSFPMNQAFPNQNFPTPMGGDWRPMAEPIGFNNPSFNNGIMDGNFPAQGNFGPNGPGPGGPMFNQNFPRGGRGGFRGGRGGWFRPQGPPSNWHGPRGGGGGHWGGRGGNSGICKQFKNNGFCRNRDNCPFIHPH